jgi:hypothetical protein
MQKGRRNRGGHCHTATEEGETEGEEGQKIVVIKRAVFLRGGVANHPQLLEKGKLLAT